MNWIWIFMYFVTVVYGYHIYYYYEGSRDVPGQPWTVDDTCSSRRRKRCRKWCYSSRYYSCEGKKCYCIDTWYRHVYDGERRRSEDSSLDHYIAHFCPNVDDAKECIFKCMKTGKPAFCGKDNVCYCGHRYISMDDNSKNNTKEAYSQYKEPEILRNQLY